MMAGKNQRKGKKITTRGQTQTDMLVTVVRGLSE